MMLVNSAVADRDPGVIPLELKVHILWSSMDPDKYSPDSEGLDLF